MLPITTQIWAGSEPVKLPPGDAAEIATGACVPVGADSVLIREQANRRDGSLLVDQPIEAGRNIRRIGEDFQAGSTVLASGTRIGPIQIAALLACGVEEIFVRRRPRLALISTGNELTAGTPAAAQVIDCNSPMITAAAREVGLDCIPLGHIPDDPAQLDAILGTLQATDADLLISTGGVSVGAYDLVRAALERCGARIVFHGIRMRPGKPMLFAILPDGRPFFGLPGNPVAALVAFRFFVVTALRSLLGLNAEAGEAARAADLARAGTTLFLRCTVSHDLEGHRSIDPTLDQRSHILASLLKASHWLRVDDDGAGLLYPLWPTLEGAVNATPA
jgi:molybdopterin molybdotransferase